jgi:hypothetical protein
VIDPVTRKLFEKMAVGRNSVQVYATPDGKSVYVANQGTDKRPNNTVSGNRCRHEKGYGDARERSDATLDKASRNSFHCDHIRNHDVRALRVRG